MSVADLFAKRNKSCGLCCTRIINIGVQKGREEILKDVNLHIHCSELTAVIGPNGAGKSTLLKTILGEVRHTGEMQFVDARGARTGHPLIGYVPQQLEFDAGSPTSVLDLFSAGMTNTPVWLHKPKKTRARVRKCLELVQADHLIDRRLGELSGGELQRVLLALALDPVPNLLLLDEPVSGMDQNGLELFYDILAMIKKEYDLSIILVSHDFGMVGKHADRVVLLNKTVECCGTPQEVFASEKAKRLFGAVWSADFNAGTANMDYKRSNPND